MEYVFWKRVILTASLILVLIIKLPDYAIVFATFTAVIVALFKEEVYSFYRPPLLSIDIPERMRFDDMVAVIKQKIFE